MERQVGVDVSQAPGGSLSVRWFVCDNGMTVCEGTALYDAGADALDWQGERPPAEYEGRVRAEITRVLRARRTP